MGAFLHLADEHSARETTPRVAIVHSFYSSRNPSGENVAVRQQAVALRRAGYTVEIFDQQTDQRELSSFYPLQAAWHVSSGRGPGPNLGDFAPDVIHVHNLFPNFGKAWIKKAPAPVVASLHNYRPLCGAGIFFRDGHTCTECLDRKSSVPAVQHGCYRGRLRSLPVAIGQRFEKDELLKNADAVIALSDQMRSLYLKAGVPSEKIHILPNFLPLDLDLGAGPGGDFWLYAGRLSEEKGILELAAQWPAGRNLVVVGSGEQEHELRALGRDDIRVIGSASRAEILNLMRGAVGLVFPSKWFEGLPMVYVEALSSGTPVLAWEPSVVASLVASEGTGTVAGQNLEEALAAAEPQFRRLREHCRSVFESTYTEVKWVDGLRRIYQAAQSTKR